ncbi:MAG: TolC family protein [Opitutus sp.]
MKLTAPIGTMMAAMLASCASAPIPPAPQPFAAVQVAGEFDARSLQDPGLIKFLVRNLGYAPQSWDFESLCWVAFYYQQSLAVARAQWDVAQAAGKTATARPNPTLSFTPGYNSTREAGLSPWFPGINLDFLLQSRRKTEPQAKIAARDSEAARLSFVGAAWQVRSDFRHALDDARDAARREEILGQQVNVLQELLTLLERRQAVGRVTTTEVSLTRTARLRGEALLAEARALSLAAQAKVAGTLGVPASALRGLSFPVPASPPTYSEVERAELRQRTLQARADVLAALAHYESAHAAVELQAARQRPDFHLGPGYQWDQGANKWSVALTFELPWFHRNEGPIAEAVARRAEAAAQFVSVQARAIGAIDAAFAAEAAARERLVRAQEIQAAGHHRTIREKQRLALGAGDRVEVLTTLLDETTDQLAAWDAEMAQQRAAGELEDALQIPFSHLQSITAVREQDVHP